MEQKQYKTKCSSMRALLWESKLEPVPNPENFWTFDPEEGDLALVGEDEYKFTEGEWVKVEKQESEEQE